MRSCLLIARTDVSVDDEPVIRSIQAYLDAIRRQTNLHVVVEEQQPDFVLEGGPRQVSISWYARLPAPSEDDRAQLETCDEEAGDPRLTMGLRNRVSLYAATVEALASARIHTLPLSASSEGKGAKGRVKDR